MSEPPILFATEGAISHLVLNRPDKINAMNGELYAALERAAYQYASAPELLCMIISGAGGNFSSGGDLAWFREMREHRRAEGGPATGETAEHATIVSAYNAFGALDKPVIAAIDGYCLASGFNLAVLYCDIRVATDRARLGIPGPRRGLGVGTGYPMPYTHYTGVGNVLYMMLTGEPMTAEQALRQGFVNEVVAEERLLERARELAAMLTEGNQDEVRGLKRFWRRYPDLPGGSYSMLADLVRHEIDSPTSGNGDEAMEAFNRAQEAFLGKRRPDWGVS
jgi:enoyl-CoA hydratase/carnithine racemase